MTEPWAGRSSTNALNIRQSPFVSGLDNAVIRRVSIPPGGSNREFVHRIRKVIRVISGVTPKRNANPGHNPVPLLTYNVIPPTS